MSQCFQKKAFIYNHLKAMNKREKSNIQKYVSLKVKEFRESAGLTQEQFAERLNRSRTFISNRENPNSNESFSFEFLNEIANEFSISPKFFMPDEGLK